MVGRAGFAVHIFDNLDDWTQLEQERMGSSVANRVVISKEISIN